MKLNRLLRLLELNENESETGAELPALPLEKDEEKEAEKLEQQPIILKR